MAEGIYYFRDKKKHRSQFASLHSNIIRDDSSIGDDFQWDSITNGFDNRSIDERRNEYNMAINRAGHEVELSMFNENTGGYIVKYKGHKINKDTNVEMEAAEIMAENGIGVVLLPEGDQYPQYKVQVIGENGNIKTYYREGLLNNISYEQKTPKSNSGRSIKEIAEHAREKRAKISVAFNNNGFIGRFEVEQSIRDMIRYNKKERISLETVLLVNKHNRTVERINVKIP